MKKTIYLRGAYGPGNLGDDVLLLCMLSILKEKFNEKDIYVGVENIRLAEKTFPNVNFVHYKKPMITNYFIYGGGGQFFDFINSEKDYDKNLLNKIYYFVKNNKNIFYALLRIFYFNNNRTMEKLVRAEHVACYSIGVGPFETKGKGLSRLKMFEKMGQYISFRDKKSIETFKDLTDTRKNIILSSDPSYILADWYYEGFEISEKKIDMYDYCFIVREWPYSKNGKKMIECMIDTALSYSKDGYNVLIVSLFSSYDEKIIKHSLNMGLEVLAYDLKKYTISEFLNKILKESKIIITSRAHGAWLPVIFGKPVLIVGIENKLDQINKSLKKSTQITKATDVVELKKSILFFETSYTKLKDELDNDVNPLITLAENNKKSFYQWVNDHE